MDISQISYPIFTNDCERINPYMSTKHIVELTTKNKTEMCLKLLKSKKKSLITNYIKDNFPMPTFSKKYSGSSRIDSEVETDIGSPKSERRENIKNIDICNFNPNFLDKKIKVTTLKRSLSDDVLDLIRLDMIEDENSSEKENIEINKNETGLNSEN